MGRLATLRILLLAGVAASASARAGAETWSLALDPAASEVTCTLGATLHSVEGVFRLSRGEVRFDPDDGSVSGEVVVDARSGATGIGARDRAMHSSVLESERYPQIVLRPEHLELRERSADSVAGELVGRLELHGATHELRLPFRARRLAGDRGEVEGSFRVPYVAWGLADPSRALLRVDKHVDVRFKSEGSLARAQ